MQDYRILKKCSALTLVELLVASVLIGLVTLGAAGVMIGMRNIQGSSRLSNFLVIHTAAVMSHIQRNVIQATGYSNDAGIVISAATNPAYYSFRQDVDSSGAALNAPQTYTNDTWMVYTYTAATHTLAFCRQTQAEGSAPTAGCLSSPTELSNKVQSVTFTWTASSTEFYVQIDLNTIFDPSAASNAMTNPTYSLSTKVTPMAYTW